MLTAEEYKRAEFDVELKEAKRGFKIHAAVYGVVMTGLIVLNTLLIVYSDSDFPWVIFPLLGWGIGLTFHYLGAFRWQSETILNHQAAIERYAERPKVTA